MTLIESQYNDKLNTFIDSVHKFKDEYSTAGVWNESYDLMLETLERAQNICEFNYMEAKKMTDDMVCFKYETFQQYVYNNTKGTNVKGSNARTKMLRQNRSTSCPLCKIECVNDDGILKCPNCRHEITREKTSQITNSISNNEKHIIKQMEKIRGIDKLPQAINKIQPFIKLWLTDMKYLKKYLIYTNSLYKFIINYNEIATDTIGEEYFAKVIPDVPENKHEYEIYLLLMSKFYSMTETCVSMSNITSNMSQLNDDQVLKVINDWYSSIGRPVIPSYNYVNDSELEHVCCDVTGKTTKSIKYEIGNYFMMLGLIAEYDTYHVKTKIATALNIEPDVLTLPGLMFNFKDYFSLKDKVPQSYNYSENYNSISHYTFKTEYQSIPATDINKMIEIILRFNNYYKINSQRNSMTKSNSPLFVCTFKLIIMGLSYFNKYIDALSAISDKRTTSTTKDIIGKQWLQFLIDNPDINKTYNSCEYKPVDIVDECVVDTTDDCIKYDDTMMVF